jgi:hypothetical protein
VAGEPFFLSPSCNIKAAFQNKQLPNLESGAMASMMSKSAYLTDEGDEKATSHRGPDE